MKRTWSPAARWITPIPRSMSGNWPCRRKAAVARCVSSGCALPRPLEVENTPNHTQLLQSIHEPQQLLVAEERVGGAARVLGYLTLIHEQALALTRVTQLVVTRTRRGEGIGNGLLVAAATSTRADTGGRSPNHRMRIETQSTNYPAIRFCQRCSFAFCGYDEQFYANGEIAVFFSRALYGDGRDDA